MRLLQLVFKVFNFLLVILVHQGNNKSYYIVYIIKSYSTPIIKSVTSMEMEIVFSEQLSRNDRINVYLPGFTEVDLVVLQMSGTGSSFLLGWWKARDSALKFTVLEPLRHLSVFISTVNNLRLSPIDSNNITGLPAVSLHLSNWRRFPLRVNFQKFVSVGYFASSSIGFSRALANTDTIVNIT